MIARLTFKMPDAVYYATEDLSEDEKEEVEAVAKKFIAYGECVHIDLDTETGEATVVPV